MELPDFDKNPADIETPSPKKPRRKPTKRKAKIAAVPKPTRRKRRRVLPLKQKPKEEVLLSPEVYKTIGILIRLNASERSLVLAIVQGLTK